HEGLLECVLGVLQGSQDAVAVHLQLVGVALDQVAERVVVAGPGPGDQVRRVRLHRHASSLFFFPPGAFGSSESTDAAGPANWAVSARPNSRTCWRQPGWRRSQSGACPGYRTGPQIMTKYVFSFRVPSDYRPNAGTPAEWQAWFGGLGPALVDIGPAVTDYASLCGGGGRG